MYLHSNRVHPSIQSILEGYGASKQIARKTVRDNLLVIEGVTGNGQRLVAEVAADGFFDDLFVVVNEQYGFLLNSHNQYEIHPISEGLFNMIGKAVSWAKGLFSKWYGKLKTFFGETASEGMVRRVVSDTNDASREKAFSDLGREMGKTPEQITKAWKEFKSAKEQMDTIKKSIKDKDPEAVKTMADAKDAEASGDPEAIKKAHAEALARVTKRNVDTVVVNGGQKLVEPKPEETAAPKDGDDVIKTNQDGTQSTGKVITISESGAKKWNDQFAASASFVALKAGLVVLTDKAVVPLDESWAVAPAAADKKAIAEPAAEPAPEPAAEPAAAEPVPAAAEPVPAAAVPNPSPVVSKTAAANTANAQQRSLNKRLVRGGAAYDAKGNLRESVKIKKGNLLEVFQPQKRSHK